MDIPSREGKHACSERLFQVASETKSEVLLKSFKQLCQTVLHATLFMCLLFLFCSADIDGIDVANR